MKILDYLDLARNSLFHRRMRSWLTVLGIVIGIAAVVGLLSIGQGFQHNIENQLSAFGGNSIFISPGKQQASSGGFGFGGSYVQQAVAGKLTTTDIALLKGVNGIEYVEGFVAGRADVSFKSDKATVNVEGATPELWKIFNIVSLENGRFYSSSETRVAVLGNSIVSTVFKGKIKVGDTITIKGMNFRVIGILQQGSGVASSIVDSAVLIPLDDSRKVFPEIGEREVSSIVAKANDNADPNRVTKDINLRMRASHKVVEGKEDFTVTSSTSIQERVSQITGTITIFLGGIAAIALLVGAIGIANTMFMSVMERTRQIGILKAIGAKNKDIRNIFIVESSLLGFVGGIVGTLIGVLFGLAMTGFSPSGGQGAFGPPAFTPYITIELIAFAIVFSIVIGAVSGYLPARRASKMEPVEALRYE